jgi:hypothetical protein
MVGLRGLVRRPVTWVVVGVLVLAGGALGLLLFEPWKLVVDDTVDEAPPIASASLPPGGGTALLARGDFISHEHGTSGRVYVYRQADGGRVLRLENLNTSNGPDLHVWITDAPVKEGTAGWRVFDDGEYTELGELKGNKGNQNYALPASVDLTKLRSVTIWCDRFDVSFGAAALS